MSAEPDAYAVLHVEPGTPAEVISAIYRSLAWRFHPDGPTPDPVRMTEINRAYNEIKTSELRRQYDAKRALVPMGPGPSAPPAGPRTHPSAHQAPAPPGGTSNPPLPRHDDLRFGGRIIDFGPYLGWRIADVARRDPDYLRWLSRHSSGARFRREIARCLPDDREVGWMAKAFT